MTLVLDSTPLIPHGLMGGPRVLTLKMVNKTFKTQDSAGVYALVYHDPNITPSTRYLRVGRSLTSLKKRLGWYFTKDGEEYRKGCNNFLWGPISSPQTIFEKVCLLYHECLDKQKEGLPNNKRHPPCPAGEQFLCPYANCKDKTDGLEMDWEEFNYEAK